MKVVVAAERFPSPIAPVFVDHVLALTRRGIHVIVTTEKVGPGADAVLRQAGPGRIELRAARGWRWRRRPDPPWFDQSADIVHFQDFSLAARHLGAVGRLRPATLVTARGSDVRVAPRASRAARARVVSVLGAVDGVICVSAELVERCTELGAAPEAVHVAHRGVDLRRFPPRPSAPEHPDGVARLVSVGRLHWVKGLEYALAAVRLLRDAGHDVTYTIVGADHGGGEAVRLAIDDLGLDGIVTLAGALPREGVRDVLARSDLFVLPSLSEGVSQAAAEAMAVGVPVVVTDVGGMRELVEDGVHGRVVPPRDPEALADAIAELLTSGSLDEVGRAAADHIRTNFDASARLDAVVDLYESVAAGRRTCGPGDAVADADPTPIPRRGRPELVSVVVPMLNEVVDLPEQLAALARQTYTGGWELLVCDNGSDDGSQEVARSWQTTLPHLRLVDASAVRGCNHARNVGLAAAQGDFIVIVDADDVARPDWLDELVDAADGYEIVAGSLGELDDPDSGVADGLPVKHDFLPSIPGGNFGMWAHVARQLTFDEDFGFGGSDIEFAWRAQLEGFAVGYAKDARIDVRVPTETGVLARQWFAYGASGPLLYRKFRLHGMPRARLTPALRELKWLALHAGDLRRAGAERNWWMKRASYRWGRVRGSVAQRVLFP